VVDRQTPAWFERANFGGIGDGGNMAFRRYAFAVWPGFDVRLGRGALLHGGEEHLRVLLPDRSWLSRRVYPAGGGASSVPTDNGRSPRTTSQRSGRCDGILHISARRRAPLPARNPQVHRRGAEGYPTDLARSSHGIPPSHRPLVARAARSALRTIALRPGAVNVCAAGGSPKLAAG
jgi:hypothetical protein